MSGFATKSLVQDKTSQANSVIDCNHFATLTLSHNNHCYQVMHVGKACSAFVYEMYTEFQRKEQTLWQSIWRMIIIIIIIIIMYSINDHSRFSLIDSSIVSLSVQHSTHVRQSSKSWRWLPLPKNTKILIFVSWSKEKRSESTQDQSWATHQWCGTHISNTLG